MSTWAALDPRDASDGLAVTDAFARVLAEPHSLDELLWHIAEAIGELLGFEDCVIYLREGDALVQAAALGVKSDQRAIVDPIVIPLGEGIVGAVARDGVCTYVPDTSRDPRYIRDQFEGRSELTVPIRFEDEIIGVLDSEASRKDAFSPRDRALFEHLATLCAARIGWLRSEQRRLEAEGEHQRQRLEALGLFSAGVAHDFNNLLAVMALNMELARSSTSRSELNENLTTAEQAIKRAHEVTKQLISFATSSAQTLAPVELHPLLFEASRFAESHPKIRCPLEVSDDLPLVQADETQLSQVLNNLLSNAVHALKGSGHIELSAKRKDGPGGPRAIIRVRDHGPGIDADDLSRLFDPYFTTRPEGSGLGLATAYWIVHRHGGELHAGNAKGNGAVFTIELPGMEGRLARSAPVTPAPALASLRVLVMDDQPEIADATVALLSASGHFARAVSSGEEAVAAWRAALKAGPRFDVALLDLTNRWGAGAEQTLDWLRQHDPTARAVVMTGHLHRANSPVAGFAAQLEKPFGRSSLSRALAKATQGSR